MFFLLCDVLVFTGICFNNYADTIIRARLAMQALLEKDYGEPIGLCNEVTNGSGIFERRWTRSHIQLDCNSYEATFKFHDE